jgi:polyisoprenoid-binding protein YceI
MTTTENAERTEVPPPGSWTIDSGHADVGFVGRHFGLTKIRGRFTGVEGTVTIGDPVERSTVEVSIAMATVISGDRARDDHLQSADFFDVEQHPTATFRSTSLTVAGRRGRLAGDLTWGNERLVFAASGTINREDWGLTWNMLLDAGGWLVSKQIRLEIDAELLRAT